MAIGGSGDYLTKLKENLSCPVCYEVFNTTERTPKGLPCYHSMCWSCLIGYVKKNLQENYHCPMCQKKFTLPAEDVSFLPTNTGLMGMLDLLPPEEEATPLDEPVVEMKLKVAKHECHKHLSVDCIMYCKTCHVPLCVKCVISDKNEAHSGHDLEEIDIAITKMKDTLSNAMVVVESLVKDHKTKVEDTDGKINQQMEKAMEKVELEINQEAETLKEKSKNSISEKYSEILKPYYDGISKFIYEKDTIIQHIDTLKCIDLDLRKQHYKQIEEVASRIEQLKNISQANSSAELFLKLEEVQTGFFCVLSSYGLGNNEPLEQATQTDQEGECITLSQLGNVDDNTVKIYMMLNDVNAFANSAFNSKLFSQYWYVNGVPWKMVAQMALRDDKEDPVMWIGVTCDNKGKDWKYTATRSMKLYDYDTDCFETDARVSTRDFDADTKSWGWDILSKKSLLQPCNKHVKNNTLMVLVELTMH